MKRRLLERLLEDGFVPNISAAQCKRRQSYRARETEED
jgi:hypothetical protein